MRRLKAFLPLILLAGPLAALPYDEAAFFTARTGYGTPAEAVYRLAGLTRAQSVDLVLSHLDDPPAVPVPTWAAPPFLRPPGDKDHPADAAARKAYDQAKEARKAELKSWYLANAVQAPWPLAEKINLFWHNHFTSSLEKLDSGEMLLEQDLMFRKLGTGRFGPFLQAVSEDPSMVVYLDGEANRKGKPNENFARELFELFTLGEGHYTENDIKETARAFTGWTVDRAAGTATFNPKLHDDGLKTIFGQTGNFDGAGVVGLVLARDRTAVFLTEKFWKFFVSPDPPADRIAALSTAYRQSGYDLRTLLRALFLEDAFWDPANRKSLVRSPMELLVGQIRTWGLTDSDPKRIAGQLARLGQDLFNPLSVKGWPEGLGWIDSATLLERRRSLADLANAFRRQWQSPAAQLE